MTAAGPFSLFRPFEPFTIFRGATTGSGDPSDPDVTAAVEYAAGDGTLYAATNGEIYAAPEPV
jgi:hypothetical protein